MMDNNNVSSQEIMNFLYDQQRRGAGISDKTIEYYKKELEVNDGNKLERDSREV